MIRRIIDWLFKDDDFDGQIFSGRHNSRKNMRLLSILFLFITPIAFGQQLKYKDRDIFFATPSDTVWTFSGYRTITIEPRDTSTYIYTLSRKKKVWAYDSVWATTDYNNTNAAIVYSAGWLAGTGQTKFINGDFQYGGTLGTARTAVLTVTIDQPFRIGFLSERYNGHGTYTVQIDSQPTSTINAGAAPIGSDKDLQSLSFKSAVLAPGTHKITVSSTQQMVIDAFRVLKLTLVPK